MQRFNQDGNAVDITPTPRILQVLGEIDFEPHKCVGELIDNSIDSFLNNPPGTSSLNVSQPEINITVPHRRDVEDGRGRVVVEDNGAGMILAELVNAARAGYSGNSPVDNLGLFGMGFNIATARLGRITQLRSGVIGETDWSIIEINFDALQRQRSFRITPRFEPKRPSEHGTRVTILNLRPEQAIGIASGISGGTIRSAAGLRNWIGRTYAKYLRDSIPNFGEHRLKITVDGRNIEPYRWCVWGKERYVDLSSPTRSGQVHRIPAYHKFDHLLGAGDFCTYCLAWMTPGMYQPNICGLCGQESLVLRERRMKGWIGIQRHLDDEEFGFDFLRNGRAILQWDKQVFSWIDPDTGKPDLEYPIDEMRARHGRIVGEVEIDHVPVHYQKDSFQEETPLWREVINNLRGASPLRPHIATKRNMSINDSLLADVYRGFNRTRTLQGGRIHESQRRRKDPWKRDLIIDQTIAKEYHSRFLARDAEYQTDAKWYEWMLAADKRREQGTQPGGDDPTAPGSVSGQHSTGNRTPSELEVLKDASDLDEGLSGAYGFHPAREVVVDVYKSTERLWIDDGTSKVSVPIKVFPSPNGTMDCFYNPNDPRLVDDDDGTEVSELVSSEVSLFIRERFYDRYPFSYVYAPVRANRRNDERAGSVEQLAQHLIDELVPQMTQAFICGDDGRIMNLQKLLSEDDKVKIGRTLAEAGRTQSDLESVLDSAQFLHSMPHLLGKLIRENPELFLDGLVFTLPYNEVPTVLPDWKRTEIGMTNANKVANLIEDVADATDTPEFDSPEVRRLRRRRAQVSHDYIREILVST